MAKFDPVTRIARSENASPDIVLSRLRTELGSVHVVRDDLLPGGTKQRAAIPYLLGLRRKGVAQVVYASPFAGFAQVALACSAARLGMACTLFCEADPAMSREGALVAHSFTRLAEGAGAQVILARTLPEAEDLAAEFQHRSPFSSKIPLGFSDPGFKEHLGLEIARQWEVLCALLSGPPRALWLPVGSGTLVSVFRAVLPHSVHIHCVDVHVLSELDLRIRQVRELPGCTYHGVPEAFREHASILPGVPSNVHYDAKLWQFIVAKAGDGDVWWNVAR